MPRRPIVETYDYEFILIGDRRRPHHAGDTRAHHDAACAVRRPLGRASTSMRVATAGDTPFEAVRTAADRSWSKESGFVRGRRFGGVRCVRATADARCGDPERRNLVHRRSLPSGRDDRSPPRVKRIRASPSYVVAAGATSGELMARRFAFLPNARTPILGRVAAARPERTPPRRSSRSRCAATASRRRRACR